MASLMLKMSISLDGYIASADGDETWAEAGRCEEGARWTLDAVASAGTHLIGAETYRQWASFWPGMGGPFAAPMNEIPKVVFSDSLDCVPWGPATIARGDLAVAVARLKQERPDGYLLAQGGVRFARSLVRTGLIDEYRLVVHPVIVGEGEPLFTQPMAIEPVRNTPFSSGGVGHVFTARPA
jgi:dihydrofolate reductase